MRRKHVCMIAPLIAAALLGAGACGGNASDDRSTGGSGNVAGTGGSGNASGTGGSGNASGTSGVCAQGAPCPQPGDQCTPDECCPCTYTCQAGVWSASVCPGCAAPICPATVPSDGAACGACDELLPPCVYDDGCTSATCVQRKWQVVFALCPPKLPCGTASEPCPHGSLCVHPGGFGDGPYCAPNPCAPGQAVTCDCAGSLCIYGYCSSADFEKVFCDCPTC
jgi:hypothetical protein